MRWISVLTLLLAGCATSVAEETPVDNFDSELESVLVWIDSQADTTEPESEDEKGSAGAAGEMPDDEPVKESKERSKRFLMFGTKSCGPCIYWHGKNDGPMREAGWTIGPGSSNLIQTVDADRFPQSARDWRVESYPTFILIEDGKEVWRHVGNTVTSHQLRAAYLADKAVQIPRASAPWTHPGNTKAELIEHLMNDGIHRGKFSRSQLERFSYSQLEQLHSAHHEGRLRGPAVQSYCPNCPR